MAVDSSLSNAAKSMRSLCDLAIACCHTHVRSVTTSWTHPLVSMTTLSHLVFCICVHICYRDTQAVVIVLTQSSFDLWSSHLAFDLDSIKETKCRSINGGTSDAVSGRGSVKTLVWVDLQEAASNQSPQTFTFMNLLDCVAPCWWWTTRKYKFNITQIVLWLRSESNYFNAFLLLSYSLQVSNNVSSKPATVFNPLPD